MRHRACREHKQVQWPEGQRQAACHSALWVAFWVAFWAALWAVMVSEKELLVCVTGVRGYLLS